MSESATRLADTSTTEPAVRPYESLDALLHRLSNWVFEAHHRGGGAHGEGRDA